MFKSFFRGIGYFFAFLFVVGLFGDDDDNTQASFTQTNTQVQTTTQSVRVKQTALEQQLQEKVARLQSQEKQPQTPAKKKPAVQQQVAALETAPKANQPATSTVVQNAVERLEKTMYVDASRLNVRKGAGKDFKVIWTLKRDQQVKVTARDGEWLQVTAARFEGWVFGTYLTNNPAPKQASLPKKKKSNGLSTAAIKKILIKRSHAYYSGNCPCPYNITRAGRKCGGRSAWSRPGGASPLCYNSDVTAAMVANYQARQ